MPKGYRVGSVIDCKARCRDVVIASITDAPVPWFSTRKAGLPVLVLCCDLIRAVRLESSSAVAYHWGVTGDTVASWRRSLGVGRMTPGTISVWRELMPLRMSQADATRGRAKSRGKAARRKMIASKHGKPMHANTRTALLAAIRRPKSETHRQAILKALISAGIRPPNGVIWTNAHDKRLGMADDSDIATELGRSVDSVRKRRGRLKIPKYHPGVSPRADRKKP